MVPTPHPPPPPHPVDVTNSFALPFDEEAKEPSIFFLDHDYLENMFLMHKKVAAKERIVGFYSSGPKVRPADILVDSLFRARGYGGAHPVLVIVDVRPGVEGLPVTAYTSVPSTSPGGSGGDASSASALSSSRTFNHVPCEVGAYEAEEVGVEHLLRDINDPTVSSLAGAFKSKLDGLGGLASRLGEVSSYLAEVAAGTLPVNQEIMGVVQDMVAHLPNTTSGGVAQAMVESANDAHLALYVGTLVRAGEYGYGWGGTLQLFARLRARFSPHPTPHPPPVLSQHDLVQNKTKLREEVELGEGGKAEKKETAPPPPVDGTGQGT